MGSNFQDALTVTTGSPHYSAVSLPVSLPSTAWDVHSLRAIHDTLAPGHTVQLDSGVEIQVTEQLFCAAQ